MISALDELRDEGKQYPLVAMFFDTTAMQAAYGAKPDLKNEEVKRTFYGMIKDFYDRIPVEYRATAQTGKPDAGRQADIVVLYTSSFFSDFDSSFMQYCNEKYEHDFGRKLVWIASKDYEPKVQGCDGICTYGAGLGAKQDDSRAHPHSICWGGFRQLRGRSGRQGADQTQARRGYIRERLALHPPEAAALDRVRWLGRASRGQRSVRKPRIWPEVYRRDTRQREALPRKPGLRRSVPEL